MNAANPLPRAKPLDIPFGREIALAVPDHRGDHFSVATIDAGSFEVTGSGEGIECLGHINTGYGKTPTRRGGVQADIWAEWTDRARRPPRNAPPPILDRTVLDGPFNHDST